MNRVCGAVLLFLFSFFLVGAQSVENGHFTREAKLWADSVYAMLDLEMKLAQIMVVRHYEEGKGSGAEPTLPPPGFILGEPAELEKARAAHPIPLAAQYVVDMRSGFEHELFEWPFPDEKTMRLSGNDVQRELTRALVQEWGRESGVAAFYNSDIFDTHPLVSSAASTVRSVSVHKIWTPISLQGDSVLLTHLGVHGIPRQIARLLPARLPQMSDGEGQPRVPATELSLEQVLRDGWMLESSSYASDHQRLLQVFRSRWLKEELLEVSVKNALAYKYMLVKELRAEHTRPSSRLSLSIRKAYEQSISAFSAAGSSLLPLTALDLNMGFYHLGETPPASFREMVLRYLPEASETRDPKAFDLILLTADKRGAAEGDLKQVLHDLRQRFSQAAIVLFWTGRPSDLPFQQWPEALDAFFTAPADLPLTWSLLAQAFFNGIAVGERSSHDFYGPALEAKRRVMPATRLKYGLPEEVNMSPDSLKEIDRLLAAALKEQATPGAQVLVARKGVVVFQRNYGWQGYDKKEAVDDNDLYDLASVSKIAATMAVAMKNYDAGLWRLGDQLGELLPEADTTDKKDIRLRDLLLHESGLPAFIPFHTATYDLSRVKGNLYSGRRSPVYNRRVDERLYMHRDVRLRSDLFRALPDLQYSVAVAPNMYLHYSYPDSMYYRMLSTSRHQRGYVYSDLNFMLLQRIQEQLSGQKLDEAAEGYFYRRLGAHRLLFNPWQSPKEYSLVPTENDVAFRGQLLQGSVHDQAAALLGGVAGHAGLFGTANDLAKMLQMYLNRGSYGGLQYLHPETVDFFTQRQTENNRRGLGFDKPELDPEKDTPSSRLASASSYGHSGFTGTLVWVDPQYDLVFIFLSNRIHPDSFNRKLLQMNVRTEVQDAVYRSLLDLQVPAD